MGEAALSDTVISFRLKRAEEFARQWKINAKRLQSLANNPQTPDSVRADALGEARTAAGIVGQRATDLTELARQRGFSAWESDPKVAPLVVEIRAVEHALIYAADALSKA
jgi:hypothetical protein